jgi:hypothetical protein
MTQAANRAAAAPKVIVRLTNPPSVKERSIFPHGESESPYAGPRLTGAATRARQGQGTRPGRYDRAPTTLARDHQREHREGERQRHTHGTLRQLRPGLHTSKRAVQRRPERSFMHVLMARTANLPWRPDRGVGVCSPPPYRSLSVMPFVRPSCPSFPACTESARLLTGGCRGHGGIDVCPPGSAVLHSAQDVP